MGMELPNSETVSAMIGPIAVTSTAEAAAQAIRDAIITGRLNPGDRLVEQRLAGGLGIGQPTLREALKELEQEGLLRKVPQKGTYVASYSQDDFRKLSEVRIVLEAFAVGQAAANLTPEAESCLASLIDGMATAAEQKNAAKFDEFDIAFHRKIWSVAGNEYLAQALERITFRIFVFQDRSGGQSESKAAVRQHEEILEGIRSRNPLKARNAFVSATLRFWSNSFHLDLKLSDIFGADIPSVAVPR